eukprot:TRINITY_DN4037_c0_g1_i1.p1 TRINITY_DN4037_c0_g1~~TRINITY_DN4037_c0_g1_i1.p1  ORF type:complete len:282 (-),score=62.37 TRINITY_DN4037_c0_g1_i1:66-890(-)
MGERKVINKYYPPDFDPSKIPKKKKPKNDQIKVRMMLPMSICCNTCGEYLYKGKKFNSRKETVIGEEYLGVKIFRFYVKCTRCSSELTIKTDPKNSDYVCEMGASRNFEPWRENQKIIDEAKQQRKKEEEGDAMKALENRTVDSKKEMDILDALDELRSMKARHSKVDTNQLLQNCKERFLDDLDLEDEMLIRSTEFQNASNFVRRLDEDDNTEKPITQTVESLISKKEAVPLKKRKLFEVQVAVRPKSQGSEKIQKKKEESSFSLVDYEDDST